jgi:hypothetical protein
MKMIVRLLPLICACALTSSLAAASSEPPATDATATATAADKATAEKIKKIVLQDDTITEAQAKQILSKGYKPEGKSHDVRYCKRERQLDSRFELKICKTALEILQTQTDSKDLTDSVQRTQLNPHAQ